MVTLTTTPLPRKTRGHIHPNHALNTHRPAITHTLLPEARINHESHICTLNCHTCTSATHPFPWRYCHSAEHTWTHPPRSEHSRSKRRSSATDASGSVTVRRKHADFTNQHEPSAQVILNPHRFVMEVRKLPRHLQPDVYRFRWVLEFRCLQPRGNHVAVCRSRFLNKTVRNEEHSRSRFTLMVTFDTLPHCCTSACIGCTRCSPVVCVFSVWVNACGRIVSVHESSPM